MTGGTSTAPSRARWLATGLVPAVLFLAGCAGDPGAEGDARAGAASPSRTTATPAPPEQSPTPSTPSPAPAEGTAVVTGDSDYGPMLFDQAGQAIYLFDIETTDLPNCYGDCAAAWPPVLTTGAPRAAGAVRADLLGTTPRSDGTTQVTYAGHPLYFYAHEGPGEVLCHDVVEYGGRWLVVTPEGLPAP